MPARDIALLSHTVNLWLNTTDCCSKKRLQEERIIMQSFAAVVHCSDPKLKTKVVRFLDQRVCLEEGQNQLQMVGTTYLCAIIS